RGAGVFPTTSLPATLECRGLEVDDLRAVNPRLIYARGHGYGVRGPDASKPAYDATAFWARGGLGDTLTPQGLPEPIGHAVPSATAMARCNSPSASPPPCSAVNARGRARWSTSRSCRPRSGCWRPT